ncbi:MAG: energy-coupling factor transporter transmembrane component T [Calditrichaceae bacterium]
MVSIFRHNQLHPNCVLCNLDPRTKLFSAFLIVLLGILVPSQYYLGFAFIFTWLFIIILFSHRSLGFYAKSILKIYPMIFFMTLPLPFHYSGSGNDILFSLNSITVFYSGLYNFFDLNLRSILIFTTSLVFVTETPIRAILKTLTILHVPKWIEAIVIYMQRFINIIGAEFHRMHLAFAARSFNMSLPAKIKAVAKMSGTYLSRLIDRSERSHLAMISRGFNGEIYTRYQVNFRIIDTMIVFFHLVMFVYAIVR